MHLEEFALSLRGHGGFGRDLRVGMHGQRVHLVDDADVLGVILDDLVEGRTDPRAVGSLVVEIVKDGDLGARRTDGRSLTGGQGELDELGGRCQSFLDDLVAGFSLLDEIVKIALSPPTKFVQFDLPAGDAPAIGPATARVTILHYYDYQ